MPPRWPVLGLLVLFTAASPGATLGASQERGWGEAFQNGAVAVCNGIGPVTYGWDQDVGAYVLQLDMVDTVWAFDGSTQVAACDRDLVRALAIERDTDFWLEDFFSSETTGCVVTHTSVTWGVTGILSPYRAEVRADRWQWNSCDQEFGDDEFLWAYFP